MPEPSIVVSAVVLRDVDGRVLLVRKRGTGMFMLPGGKPEPGETAARAAVREAFEEVGAHLEIGRLGELGVFTTAAANEAGRTLCASVFTHPTVTVPGPAAEIEEMRWVHLHASGPDIAPLCLDAVFPLLRAEDA